VYLRNLENDKKRLRETGLLQATVENRLEGIFIDLKPV
jgi:hypothetical protein